MTPSQYVKELRNLNLRIRLTRILIDVLFMTMKKRQTSGHKRCRLYLRWQQNGKSIPCGLDAILDIVAAGVQGLP